MAEIVFDVSELEDTQLSLRGLPAAQKRAARTARRATLRNLNTRVRRAFVGFYGMRTKALKDRVLSSKGDVYELWVGFNPVFVSRYFASARYKPGPRGLLVGKQKTLIPHSFRATNRTRGGVFAAVREGRRSYPLKAAELELERSRVRNLLNNSLVETQPLLEQNLEKAVERELAKV